MNEPATAPERPSSAGMYDCYLGGTAHRPVDRAAAEQVAKLVPEAHDAASANRGFLQRAVRRMAAEWGIRQFLDIGSGLPTQRNTHDVVAEAAPDGRVVYVDVDPVVVARAREMLAGAAGAAAIEGDIRKPDEVLGHPETRRLIDFTAPVGLLMVAVLHFVPDDDEPWRLVAQYVDALPSGSYLALSHGSVDYASEQTWENLNRMYAASASPITDRTRTEVERFFRGLEIVPPYQGAEPGLTFLGTWGAEDPDAADSDGSRMGYAAVARKA